MISLKFIDIKNEKLIKVFITRAPMHRYAIPSPLLSPLLLPPPPPLLLLLLLLLLPPPPPLPPSVPYCGSNMMWERETYNPYVL